MQDILFYMMKCGYDIYIYIYIYTYISLYMYMYVYVYIYMYREINNEDMYKCTVHIYIYTHTQHILKLPGTGLPLPRLHR